MKKPTIAQNVAANANTLNAFTTTAELRQWGLEQGYDSAAGFGGFKKALAAIGIDYNALRAAATDAKEAELASRITHTITLYSDAKASARRFAVCDSLGNPVWHGRFFDDDRSFSYGHPGEQSACECATARKAIWLASKIKESLGCTAIHLNLIVDAQWLTSLSGKAAILASDARRFGVELEMEWIRGTSNPADKYTVCTGFKKWDDNDLPSLADDLAEVAKFEDAATEPAEAEAPNLNTGFAIAAAAAVVLVQSTFDLF